MTKPGVQKPVRPSPTKGFIAGVAACGALLGGAAVYGVCGSGSYLLQHKSEAFSAVERAMSALADKTASEKSSIEDKGAAMKSVLALEAKAPVMHSAILLMYNKKGQAPQKWYLNYSGDTELSGVVEDPDKNRSGILHGYRRAGALVFSYASESPERPGFGTVTLFENVPANAKDPNIATGVAIVHACDCDGTVKRSSKVMEVAAAVTDAASLPADVETKLKNTEPREIERPSDSDKP